MNAVSLTAIAPAALTRKVPQVDMTDPDNPKPLPDADVPATYCWMLLFGEKKVWLSADESPLGYLAPPDPEDVPGPVIGRLVGVNLPDGSLSYGSPDHPRHRCDVTADALDRMIAAGLVPSSLSAP